MAQARRVTFHFGQDAEVRYMEQLPIRGELVRRGGTPWVVTHVEADPAGGHEARFEQRTSGPAAPAGTPSRSGV